MSECPEPCQHFECEARRHAKYQNHKMKIIIEQREPDAVQKFFNTPETAEERLVRKRNAGRRLGCLVALTLIGLLAATVWCCIHFSK